MKCPQCKEEMPLLSKVCPCCQYVLDGDGDAPRVEQLVDTLEQILFAVKSLPAPSFASGLRALGCVLAPVVALACSVVALLSGAGLFWILAGLFWLLTVVVLVRRFGRSRASSQTVRGLKNRYDYNERIARRNFGKNPEVARLLAEIRSEIEAAEAEWRTARRRTVVLWLAACGALVLFLAGGAVVRGMKASGGEDSGKENLPGEEQTEAVAPWRQRIEAFAASADNSDYGDNAARLAVLDEVLGCGEYEAAEEFFFDYAQGRMGDAECAARIVRAYLAAGRRDEAVRFVDRVAPRYASDKVKLKKMVQ